MLAFCLNCGLEYPSPHLGFSSISPVLKDQTIAGKFCSVSECMCGFALNKHTQISYAADLSIWNQDTLQTLTYDLF